MCVLCGRLRGIRRFRWRILAGRHQLAGRIDIMLVIERGTGRSGEVSASWRRRSASRASARFAFCCRCMNTIGSAIGQIEQSHEGRWPRTIGRTDAGRNKGKDWCFRRHFRHDVKNESCVAAFADQISDVPFSR